MSRKPSEWNLFVKKVYEEGKAKDSNYEFKQALVDASKRKSEMGHSVSASGVKKSLKKTAKKSRGKKRSVSASMAGGKTRRHRRHRKH